MPWVVSQKVHSHLRSSQSCIKLQSRIGRRVSDWCGCNMSSWLLALVLAVSVPALHASRYTVNSVMHPTCAGSSVTIDGVTATFTRGDDSNLCTGHLKFTDKNMCISGAGSRKFTRAMAQRACYTVGANMFRAANFATHTSNQMMLLECDAYEETTGRIAVTSTGTTQVALVEGPLLTGKECADPASNDFCFDQCYDGANAAAGGVGISTDTAGTIDTACTGGFYYAITCYDYNECETGVRTNCTGPFGDEGDCMRRAACGKNTKCANEKPGWKCECEPGFKPVHGQDLYDPYYDGCVDINECEEDEDICGTNGQCINKKGTYDCACLHPDFYDVEHKLCLPSTCKAPPHIAHSSLVTHYPTATHHYGDKLEYRCDHGYQAVNSSYYSYDYYYQAHYGRYVNHFYLTCDEWGHWSPYNKPHCEPLSCGDPGYVMFAERSVVNFHHGTECKYTCQSGYRPYGYSATSPSYFTRTCQDDGYWTNDGLVCVDIDECADQPGICGSHAKYCINTPGSYMCSCVSWYQSDPADKHCVDWQVEVPSLKPCDLIENLNLCVHGYCYEDGDNRGHCQCDAGWAGSACDVRNTELNMALALAALVLVILVIVVFIVFCCCCSHHEGGNCLRATVVKQVETSAYSAPVAQPAYGVAYAPRPRISRTNYVM